MASMNKDEKPDRAEILEEIRKKCPGGQLPAKELYAPDPVEKSIQGPLEVVHATFANCRIRRP
jgi:hypothetical protein